MDRRTRREKLEAMASQVVSPHEAMIARQKLSRGQKSGRDDDRPMGRKTSPKRRFANLESFEAFWTREAGVPPEWRDGAAARARRTWVSSNHFEDDG